MSISKLRSCSRILALALASLSSALSSGCFIDQTDKLSVVVMPEDVASGWLASQTPVDETVDVTLSADRTLVPGVDLYCLLEEEVHSFDCETSVKGDQIYVDVKVKSRDGTDDCPGYHRRLCPAVGPLAPGRYTVNALDHQIEIEIPSTVRGNQLILPPPTILPDESTTTTTTTAATSTTGDSTTTAPADTSGSSASTSTASGFY